MYSLKSAIAVFLLTCCAAFGQSRVWSSPSYGKVDPREWMLESIYTNCVLWLTMNTDPAQFSTWGVPDGSYQRHDGLNTNTSLRPVYGTNGMGCLSFDGVDDFFGYVSTVDQTGPDFNIGPSDSITVSFWVRSSNATATRGFISKQTGVGNGWYVYQTANLAVYYIRDANDGSGTQITLPLPSNQWKHVSSVYDRSLNRISLYLDGVIGTNAAYTANASLTNAVPLKIGTRDSQYCYGLLDDVSIIKTALSSNQIFSMYNYTKARYQ